MSLKELTLGTTPVEVCYSQNSVITEDFSCAGTSNLNNVKINGVTDGYLKTSTNNVVSVQQIPYADIIGTPSLPSFPSSAIVGISDNQVLTNKTINGSLNTVSNIAQSSVTNLITDLGLKANTSSLPSFPISTIVGISDNQVLTNKTINGSLNTISNISQSSVTNLPQQINNQLIQNVNSDLYVPYGLNDSWNAISPNPGSINFSGTGYPGGITMWSGATSTPVYSTDGVIFTNCAGLGQFYMPSPYVPSLGYGIACFYGGGGLVKSSSDGINWANLTLTGVSVTFPLSNIIFFNNQFIVYNGSNLYTSSTGVTWTLQASSTRNIVQLVNCGSFAISIGSGGPQYTLNGTTWIQCASTQSMSCVGYNQNLNMLIASPSSTNLNNSYYSIDSGVTWNAQLNANSSFGLAWQACVFNPNNSKFYFIGKNASNIATGGFITNYSSFINSAPLLNVGNIGGGGYSTITFVNNNIVITGSTTPYYSSIIPSMNLCSTQSLLCLQERRICTAMNSGVVKIFILNTEQQLNATSSTLLAGLGFSLNTVSGVITYSGPTLNFNISFSHGGSPGTNQANNSMSVYLKKNVTIIPTFARASLGNSGIAVGGSSNIFTSLSNADTLTAFCISSSSYSHTFTEFVICIRALYN